MRVRAVASGATDSTARERATRRARRRRGGRRIARRRAERAAASSAWPSTRARARERAAAAAARDERAVGDERGALPARDASSSTRVRRMRSARPPTVGERAGVGRRHGAHEVVDRARRRAASRCARPPACGRRNTSRARDPAARAARCRRSAPGSAPSSTISAATVTLSNTSRAVSSGRIGTASARRCRRRRASPPCSAAWRRSRVSPCRIAQFTGARPRYLRQQRAVHVERAARRQRRAAPAPACGGSRTRRGSPARAPRRAATTSGAFGVVGRDRTARPSRRRRRRRCSNQIVSAGSSSCVTTSATSTPCAQQHAQAAHADVVVGEDDGARHARPRRRPSARGSSRDRRLALEHRADHVARPLAHLLVDAADVFADEAEAEQHHADQEEREDVAVPQRRRCPSRQPDSTRRSTMTTTYVTSATSRHQHAEHARTSAAAPARSR